MQEILSLPTKESCSKDHNQDEASSGDMSRQVTFSLPALYCGLGLHRPEHKTAPWLCKALCDKRQQLPTKAPPHRTAGDKPTASDLAPADTANPSWCALLPAISLKASEGLFDTREAKINHRRVCPGGKTCSPEEQRGGAFTLAIATWMLFHGCSPAAASSCSRAEYLAHCWQNHTLVLTKHCPQGGNSTGGRSPGHSTLLTSLPFHPGCHRAGPFNSSAPLWRDEAAGPQDTAAQS